MSKSSKDNKHQGKAQAKRHDHPHKHEKYNMHKLAVVMSHNRFERNHGGEAAK